MKKVLFFFVIILFCLLVTPVITASAASLGEQLKGRILLQVESHGEAWYINPTDHMRHSMGRPADAYELVRTLGIGIVNFDLNKIPVAEANFGGHDSDGDGLSDAIETSFGTDINRVDSDGDGFSDKVEMLSGYSPRLQLGDKVTDTNFAKKHLGKIFLQVQSHGEAWYVNPVDGKRYFLARASDAFNLMRKLGLGIRNVDIEKITNASKIIECGEDVTCFYNAARDCQKAKLRHNFSINNFLGVETGISFTGITNYSLKSVSPEVCELSISMKYTDVSFSDKIIADAMTDGMTEAEVKEEIAEAKKEILSEQDNSPVPFQYKKGMLVSLISNMKNNNLEPTFENFSLIYDYDSVRLDCKEDSECFTLSAKTCQKAQFQRNQTFDYDGKKMQFMVTEKIYPKTSYLTKEKACYHSFDRAADTEGKIIDDTASYTGRFGSCNYSNNNDLYELLNRKASNEFYHEDFDYENHCSVSMFGSSYFSYIPYQHLSNIPKAVCTQNDATQDEFTRNRASIKIGELERNYTDYCSGANKLTQYYCADNEEGYSSRETICASGCSHGVCSPEIDHPECRDTETSANPDVLGTITGIFNSRPTQISDYCAEDLYGAQTSSGPFLNDYYCTSNKDSYYLLRYRCPYGCSNGACVSEDNALSSRYSCTDSDANDPLGNHNTRGTVTDTDGNSFTDSCVDDETLLEYKCNESKNYYSSYHMKCGTGYKCSLGACVQDANSSAIKNATYTGGDADYTLSGEKTIYHEPTGILIKLNKISINENYTDISIILVSGGSGSGQAHMYSTNGAYSEHLANNGKTLRFSAEEINSTQAKITLKTIAGPTITSMAVTDGTYNVKIGAQLHHLSSDGWLYSRQSRSSGKTLYLDLIGYKRTSASLYENSSTIIPNDDDKAVRFLLKGYNSTDNTFEVLIEMLTSTVCGDSTGNDGEYSGCLGDSINHTDSGIKLTINYFSNSYAAFTVKGATDTYLSIRGGETSTLTSNNGKKINIDFGYITEAKGLTFDVETEN